MQRETWPNFALNRKFLFQRNGERSFGTSQTSQAKPITQSKQYQIENKCCGRRRREGECGEYATPSSVHQTPANGQHDRQRSNQLLECPHNNPRTTHDTRSWCRFQVRGRRIPSTSARLQEILLVFGQRPIESGHCSASIHMPIGIVFQCSHRFMRLHTKCAVHEDKSG